MKKVLRLIAVGVLAAGMILGLSACSVDLDLGNGETYTLDLDPIIEGLETELYAAQGYIASIDTESIKGQVKEAIDSVDREELKATIAEFIDSVDSDEVAEQVGQIVDMYRGAVYQGIQEAINQIGISKGESSAVGGAEGPQTVDVEGNVLFDKLSDITGLDASEISEQIKAALDESGMGDMYDLIMSQLSENPELILDMLTEQGLLESEEGTQN